ncbi:MAG: SusD/RagB family nutrient-binding outer membrane lipoprotein [Bacteroidetes bacterium 4572_77]|nr:MAG: SusD/RagB family nutrient-binding outer membrane lipoprotein [Bacteroidetes bacterium 4572_77]
MKKIYLALIVLVGISVSCTKNFEDWQKDEKRPSEVPGEMLFSNAQKNLADQVAEPNVNLNNFKLWAQYWTEVTYVDEANYDIVKRTVADAVFRVFYRDILMDLKEASKIISAKEVNVEEAVLKNNQLQIIKVLEVYSYQRLVDIFGNVPYSEALNIDVTLNPSYDDGLTIYKSLMVKLDDAISNMKGEGSFGETDLYYGGDVAAWKTFAYSLKARLAITIADADDSYARGIFADAETHAFSSSSQDCKLNYLPSPSTSTNPIYQALVLSGRNDYVAANTIIDKMNELNDPRRGAYFQPMEDGTFVGAIYGKGTTYALNSPAGTVLHEATFPATIMSFTEMEFYRAEAAARGWISGDVEEYYNAAITSSFDDWGVEGAADYIASEGVAWDAAIDWKQQIGTQAWLGFYERGFEAWTTYRRLDWPLMNQPPEPETTDGETPRRFTYPINEQKLNETSYNAASAAIGGDKMETKLFWDKY